MSLAVAQLVQRSLNPENRVVINAFDYYSVAYVILLFRYTQARTMFI